MINLEEDIDGDGIDSQLITFGSFCQGIVRIALLGPYHLKKKFFKSTKL